MRETGCGCCGGAGSQLIRAVLCCRGLRQERDCRKKTQKSPLRKRAVNNTREERGRRSTQDDKMGQPRDASSNGTQAGTIRRKSGTPYIHIHTFHAACLCPRQLPQGALTATAAGYALLYAVLHAALHAALPPGGKRRRPRPILQRPRGHNGTQLHEQ